jgi:hypothetical protein
MLESPSYPFMHFLLADHVHGALVLTKPETSYAVIRQGNSKA